MHHVTNFAKKAAFNTLHPDQARRARMRAGQGPTQGLIPGLPPTTPSINNPSTPHLPAPPPSASAPVITDNSFKCGGIHLELNQSPKSFVTAESSSLLPATKNVTAINLGRVEVADQGSIQRLMYKLVKEQREVICHGALVKGIRRGKTRLSMAAILLLTAYPRNHDAFLRLLGGAPASVLRQRNKIT